MTVLLTILISNMRRFPGDGADANLAGKAGDRIGTQEVAMRKKMTSMLQWRVAAVRTRY